MQLEFFSLLTADFLAEEGAAIARLAKQIAKWGFSRYCNGKESCAAPT